SNAKIVSIEDTREVELPQRNWIASVTRPSFSDDDKGDIDEFDLLEAALRQRPDYIVMGEIRGEEGRTLFQVMSTGHTTYTTFHADSVGEVLKRFTTEPINVSKTLFTALDLVSIQRQTRLRGRKVRRSMSITEINEYNAEHDEINVQDVFQWRAEADEFDQVGQSNVLDTITFDRGWNHDDLQMELFKRRVVLAYLIRNSLNEYAQVAATIQAFISDPDTVLGLMANDALGARLEDLRSMESVQIDIEAEKESLVPRPDPDDEIYELTGDILDEAETHVFGEYRDEVPTGDALVEALSTTAEAGPAEPASPAPTDDGPAGDLTFGGGSGDGEGLESAATDLFSEFEQRAETAEADGGSEQPTETVQED
ncbi:MAG: ATPase, T2SS/T4P/T4SS family, partial [Halobacteriales archaeon]|nr:ATPase, T2SS/T4P/T4SS family [Halobacteriales archaeon]